MVQPAAVLITELKNDFPVWHDIVVDAQDLTADDALQHPAGAWLDHADPATLSDLSQDLLAEARHTHQEAQDLRPVAHQAIPESSMYFILICIARRLMRPAYWLPSPALHDLVSQCAYIRRHQV
jgi:hypothetical protein